MSNESEEARTTEGRDPRLLLERIDALWQETWPTLGRLSDKELLSPNASGDWSGKDVIAHFARWEGWHHEAIEEHLADQSQRSYEGYDSWNARWSAEDAALSVAEASRKLETAHKRLRELLGGLAPSQWDDTVCDFAQQCTLNHFPEHLGWLTQ